MTKPSNLRHRAWWLIRLFRGEFKVEEILEIVSDGTEANARHNLSAYLNGMERAGIVRKKQMGVGAPISWLLIKDVGRTPPVVSTASGKKEAKKATSKTLAIALKRPMRGDVIDVEAVVV